MGRGCALYGRRIAIRGFSDLGTGNISSFNRSRMGVSFAALGTESGVVKAFTKGGMHMNKIATTLGYGRAWLFFDDNDAAYPGAGCSYYGGEDGSGQSACYWRWQGWKDG